MPPTKQEFTEIKTEILKRSTPVWHMSVLLTSAFTVVSEWTGCWRDSGIQDKELHSTVSAKLFSAEIHMTIVCVKVKEFATLLTVSLSLQNTVQCFSSEESLCFKMLKKIICRFNQNLLQHAFSTHILVSLFVSNT